MKNEIIQINDSIFNDYPLKDVFEFLDGKANESHSPEISKMILSNCNTIILVKNHKDVSQNELLKSWEKMPHHRTEEVKTGIKKYENENLNKRSEIYFKSIKDGENKFYEIDNGLFCFSFASKEMLNEFIKHKTDDSMDLIVCTTTVYSDGYLINELLLRELWQKE